MVVQDIRQADLTDDFENLFFVQDPNLVEFKAKLMRDCEQSDTKDTNEGMLVAQKSGKRKKERKRGESNKTTRTPEC